jgi:predicted Fe-Mo cluster-binding NifX family protein
MQLGITLKNGGGLYGDIASRLKEWKYFFLLDIEDSKVKGSRIVENMAAQNGKGRFTIDELLKYRVTHVISGEIGNDAKQRLSDAGVRVFGYCGNVKEALEDFLANKTKSVGLSKEDSLTR